MRAKRSKKYRKLMHQYEMTFGFHEPYQVLVDSNFLRAVHQFKMDLIPALERTLQGKVKPLLSKCSLAAIMASQPINPKTNNPYRPYHLPPPTVLPLRHCSHNDENTPIDEVECLLSLLCPNTETMRNKEHYSLATAEPVALQHDELDSPDPKKRRQAQRALEERNQKASALRSGARAIPGVPIIYVKRSVMVLEPLSVASDRVRMGVEKSKFKTGVEAALDVVSELKRKREDGDDEEERQRPAKIRGLKKAKAPNPLSIKKPKKAKQKPEEQGRKKISSEPKEDESSKKTDTENKDAASTANKKRKRRHKSAKSGGDGGEASIRKEGVEAS